MISMLGDSPFAIIVFPGGPAQTLRQLVDSAKAKPRSLTYASAGPASRSHLAGALLERTAGIELLHVPYRGTGQSVMDLISGRIEIVFATLPPSLQLINEGKGARARRDGPAPQRDDEGRGYGGRARLARFRCHAVRAFVAPAGLPMPVARRLTEETHKALQDTALRALLMAQGVEPEASTRPRSRSASLPTSRSGAT